MVGGGPGAFIGAVHRKAAALDGEIELVAGAFSSDPEKSRQQGEELLLDSSRVYNSYQEMALKLLMILLVFRVENGKENLFLPLLGICPNNLCTCEYYFFR